VQYLLGPIATLIVAALLLVLVGALPALPALSRGSWKARLAVLVPALAFGLGATGIWLAFEYGGVMANSYLSCTVKYAAEELNGATEPIVLVIDGGSYVLNGVDTPYLTDEFKKQGFDVRAVRLAAGAANHFERYRMAQQAIERLRSKKPGQRWIYLAEVQQGYDSQPLAQFAKNQDSARSFHYMTLRNAWASVRALRSPGSQAPEAWRWQLFRHTLINSVSVGALSRFVPEAEIEPGSGRVTPRRGSRFRFEGMSSQLSSLQQPAVAGMLPWLRDVREARSRRLWRPYASELVYFGVPSTTVEQLTYVRQFCGATPRKCISPADPDLLNALDSVGFWRDNGHLSKKGADVYSRWLARQLVAQQVVTH
jgi:hypothetical protein